MLGDAGTRRCVRTTREWGRPAMLGLPGLLRPPRDLTVSRCYDRFRFTPAFLFQELSLTLLFLSKEDHFCFREQHVWGAFHGFWLVIVAITQDLEQRELWPGVCVPWNLLHAREAAHFTSQTRKPLTSLFWQKSQNCQEGPVAEALNAGKEISLSKSTELSDPSTLCPGCWSGWRQWMVGDKRSHGHFV